MDMIALAAGLSSMAAQNAQLAASVGVLRQSMQTQEAVAKQLIEALNVAPEPAHLGQNVDLLA